ncbi:MAG TPA: SMI1/KNR4 family protein [Armatimonadota bacterium]|nr:SMI1/KNR4 family protein [Armatimonadota bacterium]
MTRRKGPRGAIDHGAGVAPSVIDGAARVLGVALPQDYVEFLRVYGWASLGCNEIYGLGDDVPRHLDVVRLTLSERLEAQPAMPRHLVALMNDGFGNHDCLDTSQLRDGRCPVVFWDHDKGPNQQPEPIAADFNTWLDELVEHAAREITGEAF